nr:ATP-binding cassette domain-containing protein [Helicobacter anatolicus]
MYLLYLIKILNIYQELIVIELKNIQKTYPNGFCAIKNLNLQIQKGDIYGIIGYSGAGKSTLIRLINRLEEPTNGEVLINNTNILNLNPKALQKQRQKIGMIFQHFNLLSRRNVFDNIAFALQIAGWKKEECVQRVLELLDLVGLKDKKDFYPNQLSGGQKQRVAIARALANHPQILLCDEATSALDTKTTQSILALLKDIQQKMSLTIVLITHQIEVVRAICNKVCVINKGEIIEEGEVAKILSHPKHQITQELVATMPHKKNQDYLHFLPDSTNLYELVFINEAKDSPIISQALQKFKVTFNIHFADFNTLPSQSFGRMILDIQGEEIEEALAFIRAQNVEIESIQRKNND